MNEKERLEQTYREEAEDYLEYERNRDEKKERAAQKAEKAAKRQSSSVFGNLFQTKHKKDTSQSSVDQAVKALADNPDLIKYVFWGVVALTFILLLLWGITTIIQNVEYTRTFYDYAVKIDSCRELEDGLTVEAEFRLQNKSTGTKLYIIEAVLQSEDQTMIYAAETTSIVVKKGEIKSVAMLLLPHQELFGETKRTYIFTITNITVSSQITSDNKAPTAFAVGAL